MEFLSLSRRRYIPRETSSAAKSEEKRMFSQAISYLTPFFAFFPYYGAWSQAKSNAGKISCINYFNRNESENFIPVVKFDSVRNKCG